MKYYIEEAVVVETQETEPKMEVETVRPEVIGNSRRKKRSGSILGTIFDAFFSDSAFIDLFDMEPDEYFEQNPEPEEKVVEPEPAQVTETHEIFVREITYASAEIF